LIYDYSVAKVDQFTHEQRMRVHREVTLGTAESLTQMHRQARNVPRVVCLEKRPGQRWV